MNTSPVPRPSALNLWTLGHRRDCSPGVRPAGGWTGFAPLVTARVRPSLVLRSVGGSADNPAGEGLASGGKGRCAS